MYKIVYTDEFKKDLKRLTKKDKKMVNEAIGRISRNPYVGDEIGVGLLTKLKNKLLWLKREVLLRIN